MEGIFPKSESPSGRRSAVCQPRAYFVSLGASLDRHPTRCLIILFIFTLSIRAPYFGEWNYDVDDQFYSLVGQRMLDGALLYVDIWDRKGPILFILYAAIASVSRSAAAYQIAATISVMCGAAGIMAIARFAGASGRSALMGSILYVGLLGQFGGATGQTPVFYNTLMIGAAASIFVNLDRLAKGYLDVGLFAGMACAGLAIGIKQTAVIEASFFGIVIVGVLTKAKVPIARIAIYAVALAIIGAAPYLITGLWYWHLDKFPELWSALVESSLKRTYIPTALRLSNMAMLLGQLSLLIGCAHLGYRQLLIQTERVRQLRFLLAWATAAFMAFASFPNVFDHYALPLLPPLCLLATGFFEKPKIGVIGFTGLLMISLVFGHAFDLRTRLQSHKVHREFENYVMSQVPHHRLFVFSRSSFLYPLTGSIPQTPLAFPHHIFDIDESGVSGINEAQEVARVLALSPEAVVIDSDPKRIATNQANATQVGAYLRRCTRQRAFKMYDRTGPANKIVFSGCADPR